MRTYTAAEWTRLAAAALTTRINFGDMKGRRCIISFESGRRFIEGVDFFIQDEEGQKYI